MTTTELVTRENSAAGTLERVIIQGDLSALTPEQRVLYYRQVCESLSLNPLTKPFEYLTLDGKLVLYARRDCTDQLRKINSVSIVGLERERMEDLYVVTAHATTPDGRRDSAIGAVSLVKENGAWTTSQNGRRYFKGDGTFSPLTGDALANAIMKSETKAKRRVTLSICGLGLTDESELDTIPGARVVDASDQAKLANRYDEIFGADEPATTERNGHTVDTTTGEVLQDTRPSQPAPPKRKAPSRPADDPITSIDDPLYKRYSEVYRDAVSLGITPDIQGLTDGLTVGELTKRGEELKAQVDATRAKQILPAEEEAF